MFTSSAPALLDDFHIDGLRVDLTDATHQNNILHANGVSVASANLPLADCNSPQFRHR
jgi:1,4-alpha-glucan branching enzyme